MNTYRINIVLNSGQEIKRTVKSKEDQARRVVTTLTPKIEREFGWNVSKVQAEKVG